MGLVSQGALAGLEIKSSGRNCQELRGIENDGRLEFSGGKVFNVPGDKEISLGLNGAFQKFIVFRISLGDIEADLRATHRASGMSRERSAFTFLWSSFLNFSLFKTSSYSAAMGSERHKTISPERTRERISSGTLSGLRRADTKTLVSITTLSIETGHFLFVFLGAAGGADFRLDFPRGDFVETGFLGSQLDFSQEVAFFDDIS